MDLTSPGGTELECSPSDYEIVGSNPGRIPAVTSCQFPCQLVRHVTLIVRGRIHHDITNNVDKDVKSKQIN